jgi:hypothetical protein
LFRYNLDSCFKLVIIKIITQLRYHFKPVESLRDSDLVGPGPPCRRGERQVTRTLLVTGLGPGAAAPAVGSRVRVADKHRDWHGLVDSSASDPAGFKFTVIDSESALLGSSCLLQLLAPTVPGKGPAGQPEPQVLDSPNLLRTRSNSARDSDWQLGPHRG